MLGENTFGPMLDGFILPFKCFIFLLFWMFFSNVRCFIFLCFIIKCFMLIHILYILTDVGCWIFIFCLILNVFIFSILNVGCFMFSLGFLSLSLLLDALYLIYLQHPVRAENTRRFRAVAATMICSYEL